jgi:hypothetical protein
MRESNSGILIGDLGLALPLRYMLVLGRCHICGLLLEFLAVVVFEYIDLGSSFRYTYNFCSLQLHGAHLFYKFIVYLDMNV